MTTPPNRMLNASSAPGAPLKPSKVGESPAEAAVRETREEIGVEVRLMRVLDVLGGPDYEVSYPNGDRTAYVTTVYRVPLSPWRPRQTARPQRAGAIEGGVSG
jgi:8-oxo-dGTP pyrophosphatase MutT (NUDIX family)